MSPLQGFNFSCMILIGLAAYPVIFRAFGACRVLRDVFFDVKNSTPFLINRNIEIPAGSAGILPASMLKWRTP
jgi:hypothetical protein